MRKIILAISILITTSFCFGQYNFGFYAGWQNCSSHQKIVRDELPVTFIYRHFLPDMGFVAGVSVSHPLGSFIEFSNKTGYSQVNLRRDSFDESLQERNTMHFATTEFKVAFRPFALQPSVLSNVSFFAGGGIKVRLDKDDPYKSIHTPNGNPMWPNLKTGLTFDVGRLTVSPNIHIPLAPFYKQRDIQEFQFNLYLRTWGVNVGYRIGSK